MYANKLERQNVNIMITYFLYTKMNQTLYKNRRKHQPQDFLTNNELVNNPDIIVNEFNAYFVNIAKNLADSIPVADHFSTYLNDPSNNTFKFDLVTERDVAYIIQNLNIKKVMVMIIYPIFY